jgi:hypothetical protein
MTEVLEWLARVWFGRCGLVARVPQNRMPLLRGHGTDRMGRRLRGANEFTILDLRFTRPLALVSQRVWLRLGRGYWQGKGLGGKGFWGLKV